jgi:alcohol dehydrogenase
MKAVFIRRYGKADVMEYGEQPRPSAGPGELLLAMKAASINPIDYKVREGKAKVLLDYKMPLIMGNDGSGIVEEVGPGVTRFRKGDAVMVRPDKSRIGTFAEYCVVRESDAARRPSNLSFEEAASLPLVGLTCYQAIVTLGRMQKGQSILIHAGSGGIGTFAIQFAKHLGLMVTTTTSTGNIPFVKSLGADAVIDYKTTRFEDACRDLDMVFDTLGGETLKRSFQVVKKGGVVVSITAIPDAKTGERYHANAIVRGLLHLMNSGLRSLAKKTGVRYEYLMMEASGKQLEEIADLAEKQIIRPVVDRVFDLSDMRAAFEYAEKGHSRGKVVFRIN